MSAALSQKFFSAPFSLPVLKADRSVFGKLVGAATIQLMTLCQKRNSNHCVNMSPSELTLTILGIAQIFQLNKARRIVERNVYLCCGSFCSRHLPVTRILSGATEIFFVNLYIRYWVIFKCCLKTCKLWIVMLALEFLKDKGEQEQQDL